MEPRTARVAAVLALLAAIATICPATSQKTMRAVKPPALPQAFTLPQTADAYWLAVSPDSTSLAVIVSDGYVTQACVWALATRTKRFAITAGSTSIEDDYAAVAFSRDSRILACGNGNGAIELYRTSNGKQLRVLPGRSAVKDMEFSPDDALLAVASEDGAVRLWDVKDEVARRTLRASGHYAFAVAWSPDGKTLAVGGDYDGRLQLWDTTTWKPRRTLRGHMKSVGSLAFSPDGKLLASASWDGSVRLWNATTGKCLRKLATRPTNASQVAFSRDSRWCAAAGSGTEIWSVRGGRGAAYALPVGGSVAFTSDGRWLVTSSGKSVVVWDSRLLK